MTIGCSQHAHVHLINKNGGEPAKLVIKPTVWWRYEIYNGVVGVQSRFWMELLQETVLRNVRQKIPRWNRLSLSAPWSLRANVRARVAKPASWVDSDVWRTSDSLQLHRDLWRLKKNHRFMVDFSRTIVFMGPFLRFFFTNSNTSKKAPSCWTQW